MMRLGGSVRGTKICTESEGGGQSPRVRTPRNVAVGYDAAKLSAGCLANNMLQEYYNISIN